VTPHAPRLVDHGSGLSAASKFRPDIEGLRAVAILLVVAYHAGIPGFGGGYVGVDVFFVLSGYLVTGLLVDEWNRTGRISFRRFYARRARRLLPGAALMLLTTLIVGRIILSPLEQQLTAATAVATAAYVSNLWFARWSIHYLAGSSDLNPLLHTWSLGVEEQFYLVWPALVALVARTFRGDRRVLLAAMGVLAAVSLATSIWLTRASQPWAFFGSPARGWEFAVGAIGLLLSRSRQRPSDSLVQIGTIGGLLGVITASVVFRPMTAFPGTAAMLPVLGTVAVLLGGAYAPQQPTLQLLYTRPFQAIGKLSYSWYLWHWPLPLMAAAFLGELGAAGRIGVMFAALGIAAATHALVENPIRYSAFLSARPLTSLSAAAVLTLGTVSLGIGLRREALAAASGPTQRRYTAAHDDQPRIYGDGCHLTFFEVQSPDCTFGDATSDTVIVLFGDSHAAEWFPPLERIAINRHWRLVSLTKSSCPSADGSVYLEALRRQYTECDQWRAWAMRRIESLHPALVVVSNANVYDFGAGTGNGEQWATAVRRTLAHLDTLHIRTVLVADSPRPGFDVPTCLSRAAFGLRLGRRSCAVDRRIAIDSGATYRDAQAAMGLRGARVIDLSNAICGPSACEPEIDGVVVYSDNHHLTATFASGLARALAARLDGTGGRAGW
jgi:peptidoglycan/LPS O-acetylase OafA/YrhL